MDSIQRFVNRLNTRHLILVVVIWWLAMIIVYSIITLRVNNLKDKLKETGVEITHEFSDLVSLPLLEKNSQSISTLLTDAVNRTDVIYASVVDHRNKVVAFTGTGHLMPDRTEAVRSIGKVAMWEGGFTSHAKILNFVSDVILFGSQATGKAFEFSDHDILVIVSHPISWRQKREIGDEIYSIDLKYNILTDVKIISEPELKTLKGKQPFIQRALQEGIVA